MTKEEAKAKYKDTEVMVLNANALQDIINTFGSRECDPIDLLFEIEEETFPMLRCEAELDPEFVQPIPYTVLIRISDDEYILDHKAYDFKIFTTHRIDGDSRLVGKYSIGTGGHIDPEETILQALARELEEEVGIKYIDDDGLFFSRFAADNLIYNKDEEVNSVHCGIVGFLCMESDAADEVAVKEPEKLAGEWMTASELIKLAAEGRMESWSVEVLGRILSNGIYCIAKE